MIIMGYRDPESYSFGERTELVRSTVKTLDDLYKKYRCAFDQNPVEDPRLKKGVPYVLKRMHKEYSRILKIIEKPERKRKHRLFRIREKWGLEYVTMKSSLCSKLLDVKQIEEIDRLLNEALEMDIGKHIANYQDLPVETRGTERMTEEEVEKTLSLGKISAAFYLFGNPEEYWKRKKALAEKSDPQG
ncbi:MAG: hypothetical protein GTN43_04175 [Candidatus Aenigmarchaeota archaeon]|nr:hypothetical protein [Candidatus Aenigmarchaeota archaeon]